MAGTDNKGKPSGQGKSKGNIKNIDAKRVLDLEREEVYRDRYTDDADKTSENAPTANPNRNTNKGHED